MKKKIMDLKRGTKRGMVWIYKLFHINGSDCLQYLGIHFWKDTSEGKRGFLEEQQWVLGFLHSIAQRREKNCSLTLISQVPSLRKIPCSTSAWESSETRSDIAQSSPADRQFSYWPWGFRPSLVSASRSSSGTRSASGDPAALPSPVFLRDLGGLFRKNLFCDDRASWDKMLTFLDWLIWHDLAIERNRQRNHIKNGCMLVCNSLWQFKHSEEMSWDRPVPVSCLKQNCECQSS